MITNVTVTRPVVGKLIPGEEVVVNTLVGRAVARVCANVEDPACPTAAHYAEDTYNLYMLEWDSDNHNWKCQMSFSKKCLEAVGKAMGFKKTTLKQENPPAESLKIKPESSGSNSGKGGLATTITFLTARATFTLDDLQDTEQAVATTTMDRTSYKIQQSWLDYRSVGVFNGKRNIKLLTEQLEDRVHRLMCINQPVAFTFPNGDVLLLMGWAGTFYNGKLEFIHSNHIDGEEFLPKLFRTSGTEEPIRPGTDAAD